ncbi:MAG: DUF5067 domain-containing protein [Clostridiales bacterium]|nr:DUF5067 domain-containing protein [Clostridiales bacterium]
MKKLLIILCAAVLLCSCSQNKRTVSSGNTTGNDADMVSADDLSSEETDVMPADESSVPSGFSVDFENAYYTSSGGTNYILVEAAFTNDSDSNMSFNEVYSLQAFQDGVGLTQTNNWNAGKYDMTAYAAPLKSNYSTKVYIGFEARHAAKL